MRQKNIANSGYPSDETNSKVVGKIAATQIPKVVPTSRHRANRIWSFAPIFIKP